MTATRRLAAIMFTDTVGYSASSQTDESGTLRRLREQEELVRPLLKEYQGREIKSTGDGFLVEFDSALKAAQCAIEIQRRMHERNSQRNVVSVQLRIGIHLGDVEEHGDDIFGDAVNIAARVEPMADPGGVCVSGPVFDQVHHKIPNALEKLPPANLKNLRFPVDLYRIVLPWISQPSVTSRSGPIRLAVLPLANISPDPTDEYFADGLTEELITVLSQLRDLRVIARTSVNLYRSTPKSVSQIGSELGVQAVLEGSVRKAGDQLRVTVQLIDVGTQEHTWANTFDRKLDNVFAVQAEIAERTARALLLELVGPDRDSLRKVPTADLAAYNFYLRGIHAVRQLGYEGHQEAIGFFEKAFQSDPGFAAPYAHLANVLLSLAGETLSPKEAHPRAKELIAKALELDPNSSDVRTARGNLALQYDHDWVLAEGEFQRAISINPSNAIAHRWYSSLLVALQRFDEAVRELRTTIELDPLWELPRWRLKWILRRMGDTDSLIAHAEDARDRNPQDVWHHIRLAFAYIYAGRIADARRESEFPDSEPPDNNRKLNWALVWAWVGRTQDARRALRELEEASRTRYVSTEGIAEIHAVLGDKEKALEWLERNQGEGSSSLWAWYQSPAYDSMRDDPRFRSMLERLNLPTDVKWVRAVGEVPGRFERGRRRRTGQP